MDKILDERLGAIEKEIRKKTQLVKERPNHIHYNDSFSSVSSEKELDLAKLLDGYIPDFIRLECTQTATLEYEDTKHKRRVYARGLQANVALKIEAENWVKVFITPSSSATIYVYASSSGWQKLEEKKIRPKEDIGEPPDPEDILEELEEVIHEDEEREPSSLDPLVPGGI